MAVLTKQAPPGKAVLIVLTRIKAATQIGIGTLLESDYPTALNLQTTAVTARFVCRHSNSVVLF